eukprot:scpid85899/ scgid30080/ 
MKPAQQLGLLFALFAVCCLYFGVVWSFDNGLLMLGNAALMISFGLILGPWSVVELFIGGARGVLPFLLGVALVFYNYRVLGMVIELYGAVVLVMAALPQWLQRARQLPFIGWIVPKVFPSAFRNNNSLPRRHAQITSTATDSDSDGDGNAAMQPSRTGSEDRDRSPLQRNPRWPRGAQMDGALEDAKSEYDADQEADLRRARITGIRPRPKLASIGRRMTVY